MRCWLPRSSTRWPRFFVYLRALTFIQGIIKIYAMTAQNGEERVPTLSDLYLMHKEGVHGVVFCLLDQSRCQPDRSYVLARQKTVDDLVPMTGGQVWYSPLDNKDDLRAAKGSTPIHIISSVTEALAS